jgi:hypothetical protein
MGTRFRLFVQPPYSERAEPEVIVVSSPVGSVGAGPSDDFMYVVEPIGKRLPYGVRRAPSGVPFNYLPPWDGRLAAPALPGPDGHFDHYDVSMPGFAAQHVFGCVRFTLDVWEHYLGQPLEWHFRRHFERLEIAILRGWDNAQYGYGFLEVGSERMHGEWEHPFSLDFDVIAHEVGHALTYSLLGHPRAGTEFDQFGGFQEAFADFVSLIAAMHFPSVVDEVLTATRGNLYLANRLARFSEISNQRQLRTASNTLTLADFPNGAPNEHELSQPLTGALFDILVDVFHDQLAAQALISEDAAALAERFEDGSVSEDEMLDAFDRAYGRDPAGFRAALFHARDTLGRYLAEILWRMSPDYLDYAAVADALLAVDWDENDGMYAEIMVRNFKRRSIAADGPPAPPLSARAGAQRPRPPTKFRLYGRYPLPA